MLNPFKSRHAQQVDQDLADLKAGRRTESGRRKAQVDAEVQGLRRVRPVVREARPTVPPGTLPGSVAAGGPRRPLGPNDNRQQGQSRGVERRGFPPHLRIVKGDGA